MLRRLSVRGKVLAVLAVPILVLVLAAAFVSAQALNEVRTARAINGALGALQTTRVFAQTLQTERAAAIIHVSEIQLDAAIRAGNERETSEQAALRPERAEERAAAYQAAKTASDAIMRRAQERLGEVDFDALDPLVAVAAQRVTASLSDIGRARQAVEQETVNPNVIDGQYSGVIRQGIQLTEEFANTIGNRQLGTYLGAYALVDLTNERIINERDFGFYAIERNGSEPSMLLHLRSLFPETNSVHARARAAVAALAQDELTMPELGASFDGFAAWQSQRINLAARDLDFETVRENLWYDKATIEAEALSPTLSGLWSESQRNAQAAQSAALSQATLTIIAAVAAVALSILVALLISRTIIVPLTRLTSAAGEVRDQLPRLVAQVSRPGEGPDLSLMQIPVESTDEIGRLANAFNEVNQTTVEVAQEQAALRGSIAEMFVNVARRDQVLLNRQLSFIDTLEREEEDPNTLANLFRLDHLATRMRRNAESLLVLAGIDSGRRVRGSMTLSDVIRTASSEIEQYDRVNLELGVDPHMHGFNSLPAAHMLAEILENATVFSEPGTPVEVVTSAEIEFITVTIVDRGLGMSDEDIAAANARIRQTTAGDVIGAQRLGLHVVGRIAGRLGTKVVFAKADDEGGTQVRVRFPRALFVDDAEEAQAGSGGRLLTTSSVVVEEEAPVVEAVDIEALTDGETGLGLPRRRADAPSQAPAASAPTTSSGLPARRNIVLPETVTPNLAPEVAASAAAGWAPDVKAPAASGLPSRNVGATAATQADDDAVAAPPRPAAASLDPERRSGMFAGFRRGVEAAESEPEQTDAAEPEITESAEARRSPGMVVPGLVPDDDSAPAPVAPSAGSAPAPELEPHTGAWDGAYDATVQESLANEAPVSEVPAQAWQEPERATAEWTNPVLSTPSQASPDAAPAAWEAPATDPAPATWEAPAAEPAPAAWEAPAQEATPAAWGVPVQETPAAWEAPAPAEAAPLAWEAPAQDAPAAWNAPASETPAAAWNTPAQEAPAQETPVWGPPAPEAAAPQQPAAPVPSWGPADAAWSPAQPEPVVEPQFSAPQSTEPQLTESPYAAPSALSPAIEPEATPYAAPEAPAARYLAPDAPATQYPAFTPDAGYAPAAPEPVWSPDTSAVPSLEPDAPASVPAPAAAVWSPTDPAQTPGAPSAPASVPSPAGESWLSAVTPAPEQAAPAAPVAPFTPAPVAAAPLPPVPAAPALPAFADVVGQTGEAPSRRSRRTASSGSTASKPSRADRRAARKAEQKARAEQKALAKAEARATKKNKGKAAPAGPVADAAPTPGFLSQPTSIAALRSEGSPVAAPAPQPAAWSATAAPQPSAPAPQAAWSAPVAEPVAQATPQAAPSQAAPSAPFAPAFQPRTPASPAAAPPAAPASGTAFTPSPSGAWTPGGAGAGDGSPRQFGVLDDEVAAMLALRSDIQEQALSELSQLSAYRPQVVKPAASLAKRTPSAIPSAPEMAESESGQPVERDAEQLRSRLSSFQSGATRGRRAQVAPTDSAPSSDGAVPMANGSAEHASPGASTSEANQEAQTW